MVFRLAIFIGLLVTVAIAASACSNVAEDSAGPTPTIAIAAQQVQAVQIMTATLEPEPGPGGTPNGQQEPAEPVYGLSLNGTPLREGQTVASLMGGTLFVFPASGVGGLYAADEVVGLAFYP